MTVPEGMTIGIGNKVYKAGAELPKDYKFPKSKKSDDKKVNVTKSVPKPESEKEEVEK